MANPVTIIAVVILSGVMPLLVGGLAIAAAAATGAATLAALVPVYLGSVLMAYQARIDRSDVFGLLFQCALIGLVVVRVAVSTSTPLAQATLVELSMCLLIVLTAAVQFDLRSRPKAITTALAVTMSTAPIALLYLRLAAPWALGMTPHTVPEQEAQLRNVVIDSSLIRKD